ncbi:MAG: alpha/beta hydrolase, partial [Spirosomataceae bacterium]
MKKLILLFLMASVAGFAQRTVIELYSDGTPGLKPGVSVEEINTSKKTDDITRVRNVTKPTLTVFVPK